MFGGERIEKRVLRPIEILPVESVAISPWQPYGPCAVRVTYGIDGPSSVELLRGSIDL
jgi:hypothetical protein